MITSVAAMISAYVEAWNEKGQEDFRKAFAEIWADDATYLDNNTDLVTGLEGITSLATTSLGILPIRKFEVLTTPEYHHNVGRYNWKVILPDVTKEGFDYFEFNDDYKITRIVSFL